jgi:hypothetical protein
MSASETNDYSFMLQSIEKKLASSISNQVNEYYKKNTTSKVITGLSSPKEKSTIIQSTPTIELPSHIGTLTSSSPFPSHQPFIDHSLSSIMHGGNSILKKRRISNENENIIWNDEDLNENEDNKEKGKTMKTSSSLSLTSSNRQQHQQQQPFS